ncbi:predicted protein [Histoplasma capsulatum H143]|uniref:Uncharacterized protein n=1 Tax=Ajellomyces capsulatus (strain H143) TaxID=544712 RepID=C6HC62_AJECH|nr:predicted protein [Histoplasma capsulatum H143]
MAGQFTARTSQDEGQAIPRMLPEASKPSQGVLQRARKQAPPLPSLPPARSICFFSSSFPFYRPVQIPNPNSKAFFASPFSDLLTLFVLLLFAAQLKHNLYLSFVIGLPLATPELLSMS